MVIEPFVDHLHSVVHHQDTEAAGTVAAVVAAAAAEIMTAPGMKETIVDVPQVPVILAIAEAQVLVIDDGPQVLGTVDNTADHLVENPDTNDEVGNVIEVQNVENLQNVPENPQNVPENPQGKFNTPKKKSLFLKRDIKLWRNGYFSNVSGPFLE